jgi:hypothetical protein
MFGVRVAHGLGKHYVDDDRRNDDANRARDLGGGASAARIGAQPLPAAPPTSLPPTSLLLLITTGL